MHRRATARTFSSTRAIRARLLEYYDAHARALPWRTTRDPYRIWLSEVMLQQTRVAVAVQRYPRFLERFPDLSSLARATAESVCEEWAGLGYYSRARNLHTAARAVQRSLGGRMPRTAGDLRKLSGVGEYTAGAIASIAFGEQVPAIDANAERVLARLLARSEGARDRVVRELAGDLVVCERPGDVNQALMDVGALVCTLRAPRCAACPLRHGCSARALDTPELFPAKRRRATVEKLDVAFAWIPGRSGGLWLERRALAGLWSGLWQPPAEQGPRARARLSHRLGVDLGRTRVRVRHALTHRSVDARVYAPECAVRLDDGASLGCFADPLGAPLSALARKAIVAMTAAAGRGGRRPLFCRSPRVR